MTTPTSSRRHARSSRMKHAILMATLVVAALCLTTATALERVVQASDEDLIDEPTREMPALDSASWLRTRKLQSTSSNSGSGSASPTPTPTPSKKKLITITIAPPSDDDPTAGNAAVNEFVGTVAPEEEQTFFGLFPTRNLYLGVGMGAPAVFLLYKLGMACWFCTAGRRKFRREDREHEAHALMEREEAERVAAAQAKEMELAKMHPHQHQHSRVSSSVPMRASLSKDSRAFTKQSTPSLPAAVNGGSMSSTFWVEEELQAWRLDFQQLKLMKCLTSTPDQKRHQKPAMNNNGTTRPAAGEVWLATYYAMDEDNNQRLVALKWIPPKLSNTEIQQEKLKEEIKRQAKLRHPNVVSFIGIAWSPETNLVAVTEYMARGDLRQWLHRSAAKDAGHWTPAKVKMLLDITNALVYLHSFQPRLIHGNCNSRNVLLNDRMQAKLSDFGAPKDYLSEREINAYKEVGSGRWISPEALIGRDGAEHVSDAMDVYSLGILMVEMDTHQLPFADLLQADRSQLPEIDVLQLISNGALTPTLSPTCHPRIQQLVHACTAYMPQKRPSSRDIARTLQAVLMEMNGHGGGAPPAKRQ